MRVLYWLMWGLLGALPAMAQDLNFSLESGLAAGGGISSYDFEESSGSTNYFSQLDFPLPPLGIRVVADLRLRHPKALPLFQVHAEALAAFTHPQGSFIDQDWTSLDAYPTVPRTLFSYTESETQALVLAGTLGVSWALSESSTWSSEGRGGLSLRRSRWEALETNGWSYDLSNSNALYFSRIVNQTVLTYEVWEFRPSLGWGLRFLPEDGWEVSGWFDGGVVIAWDIDDHVLRSKRSTALALGLGGVLGLQSQWFPAGGFSGLVGTLGASVSAFRSAGTQVQYWYGNLEAPAVPAGTTYAGLSHVIRSVEVSFSATLGYLW